MKNLNTALVYDIEIVNGIPPKNESEREQGIEYCAGWTDYANMGISVIGAYDYFEDRYRTFCIDNMQEFFELATKRAPLVTFNGIRFDNKVIAAELGDIGQIPETAVHYDILQEIWRSLGLDENSFSKLHTGYGLDAMADRNVYARKTGNGALAPVLWQRGKIGEVIDYCLQDVRLTELLYDLILTGTPLVSPKDGSRLHLRNPNALEAFAG